MRALLTLTLTLTLIPGCVSSKLTFTCDAAHSCGSGGTCVAGSCAFAAADCPSGLRFDKSAATAGGQCVPPDITQGDDMGMESGDLAGQPIYDFAGIDTGNCTPTGPENCFDGIDNDCNGLTDCEDTAACGPVAECVPQAPSGAQYGGIFTSGAMCPTFYSSTPVPLNQGLNVPGGCSGCSCTPSVNCEATLKEYSATTCPSTPLANYNVDALACTGTNITTSNVGVSAFTAVPKCSPTGTPAVPATTWTSSLQFCQTTSVGAGCNLGYVCVPKTGATANKHCTLDTANASCATNYAPQNGGQWYKTVTDTRDCGSLCFCQSPSGGSCGASTVRLFYQNGSCTGSANSVNANADTCGLSQPNYMSAQVFLNGTTNPSCTSGNTVSGTATATGQQTLCCF